MSTTPHISLSPLMKHRLAIFVLGIAGTSITQALGLGIIPAAIAGPAASLLGEILTYEQSQPA